ncbi:Frag1/DRAM/Sfk1 family-domain-containing protein [Rhodofomes roseus]|uniref:Frag1/DRAM/Sfk1 family-domain-containing protein n=1 Tax=Rhodofomes roseus TaxID=34475 RepID=A0ABQ8KKY5_9APHY|nr:Frag1/DRAM/Sfk1 family-domain-containing protein [Rhodofomes roseus]KAH9838588.1 Frag1/DRAM/Sfk1 family-domain-containing protein [Rhodofomes roseus]
MFLAYEHYYWVYAWIPVFGAFIWFGTLWAMLITWLATGKPQYVTQQGSIAYISDVGASYLKPLFIVCCCITGVTFFLTLVVERWLRHSGRLHPNMRRRERVFSTLAVLGSFIGGAGLILLSIFDTGRHQSLHRVFLLVFIIGVGLSAIFTIVEYRWINKDYDGQRKLRIAYIAKGIIASLLIILAVVFAITLYTTADVGAVIEWVIAFGYTFYLLTFYYDLRMSRGMRKGAYFDRELLGRRSVESGGTAGTMRQVGGPAYGNGSVAGNGYANGYGDGNGNGNAHYGGQGPYGAQNARGANVEPVRNTGY